MTGSFALLALAMLAIAVALVATVLAVRMVRARRVQAAEVALLEDGLESLGHAFALFDPRGRLVRCNRRYRAAYPAIADLLVPGARLEDLLAMAARRDPHLANGTDLGDWVRARIDRPLADDEAAWHRLGDGRWYRISEFRTGAGGVVKLLTDVTEERRRSEALAQVQKMEAIGRLASGLAHEFSNIMTAVTGFAEMARNASGEDAVRRHLDNVIDGAGRATRLSRQLLDLGRSPDPHPQRVRVDDAVGRVETMLRFLAGPEVTVAFDLEAADAEVSIDPTALGHALVNLAINARDAMPGGGRLTIAAQRAAAPAQGGADADGAAATVEWVALSVADTGTGMSDDVRARVFEPFYTTKPAGRGTGLGLALVEATVRQAGGRIELESAPGSGTRVTLLLPASASAGGRGNRAAPDATKAATVPPSAPAPEADGEPTLLVVDDETPVRDWIALALEARGYRVRRAASAAEAVAKAAREPIGLLISDVMLPDAAGPSLAARLTESRPGLPVIFMSGIEPRRPANRRLVARNATLLAKPFDEQRLADAVARALGCPAHEAPTEVRYAPAAG